MAQVASSDGASRRRMIGGPSELALATGRDFYEDGMGDEEKLCGQKLCGPSSSSESSFAGDNLDEAEQVAAAQLTTGGSTIVTRSMARRASGAQTGTREKGSPTISTNDAEVEAVGDSLSYMYLFESSSASDSDARPYSFTVSGTQAVASTDSTVA